MSTSKYKRRYSKKNSKEQEIRTEALPSIRLTPWEKKQMMQAYNETYHSSIAAFVREKIFASEITDYHKKRIDAFLQLGAFTTELQRIGNNVNQIAKVVNAYKNGKLHSEEQLVLRELLIELVAINELLTKIRIH